jgi:hypothetical protein
VSPAIPINASWYGNARTMTQVARPETARPLADVTEVTCTAPDAAPRGRGCAAFDDPDWDGRGEAAPRIEREVVMITGSHHQQIYWYATGQQRLLGQLPGASLIDEALDPATNGRAPSAAIPCSPRPWNRSAWPATPRMASRDPASANGASERAGGGYDDGGARIACESCHSPGGARGGNASPVGATSCTSGQSDASIVQPARLDRNEARRSVDSVTGSEFYDTAGETRQHAGLPFRPGEALRHQVPAQPTVNDDSPEMKALLSADPRIVRDLLWPDGQSGSGRGRGCSSRRASRTRRIRRGRSPFVVSYARQARGDEASRPVGGRSADATASRTTRTPCHSPSRRPARTRHSPRPSGSSCYNADAVHDHGC